MFDLVVHRLVLDSSVLESGLIEGVVKVAHSVLHPVDVVSVREVVSRVSSSRFLSGFCREHSHLSLDEQVLKFEGLDQVGVPDFTSIRDTNIMVHLRDILDLSATFLEQVLLSEHSSVSLHSLLHGKSDLGSALRTLRVSQLVKSGD